MLKIKNFFVLFFVLFATCAYPEDSLRCQPGELKDFPIGSSQILDTWKRFTVQLINSTPSGRKFYSSGVLVTGQSGKTYIASAKHVHKGGSSSLFDRNLKLPLSIIEKFRQYGGDGIILFAVEDPKFRANGVHYSQISILAENEQVYALGYPSKVLWLSKDEPDPIRELRFSLGTSAAYPKDKQDPIVIRSTLSTTQGMSGGPVFTESGALVAVVRGYMDGSCNQNLIADISMLKEFLASQ